MLGGIEMRFREMAPDEGLWAATLTHLDNLTKALSAPVHCSVEVTRSKSEQRRALYEVRVDLDGGRCTPRLWSGERSSDPHVALREAFKALLRLASPASGAGRAARASTPPGFDRLSAPAAAQL